ncbi:MAG TPA: hypothetical protein VI894_01750 [Candidatus Nanoarchaeia archaeon]|nr:hypothetical protein [Candidatus Nanoarchaeia archaeon]
MKERDEDLFYVGIKEGTELRRSILESSKDAIQTLQRLERLKEVKTKKQSKIHELKELIREINKLNSRLKLDLPKTKMMEESPKKEKVERREERIDPLQEIKETGEIKEIKKAGKNEIEKLGEELRMIEEKLGKLS